MAMTDADRIAALEAENAALKSRVFAAERDAGTLLQKNVELHAEILHLRIYAPGRHVAREPQTIKQIAPTDWAAWGIKESEISE